VITLTLISIILQVLEIAVRAGLG